MKRYGIVLLLIAASLILAACGPKGVAPDENGEIIIIQEDGSGGMSFSPNSIVLTAGQTVTIVIENKGEKDHEFMIGREVEYSENGAPDGFHEDFFEGWEDQVEVVPGMGAMLMIGGEAVMMGGDMGMSDDSMSDDSMSDDSMSDDSMSDDSMSDDSMSDDSMSDDSMSDDGEAEHTGWMLMDPAGSSATTITFTVPSDMVGEWEMACFEDNGSHYDDGMRGTIVVVAP